MKKPKPRSLSLSESQSDLRWELQLQWLWQLLLTMMLLALSLTVNQVFTAASSLRRYLGGLPWFGWAGMMGFLAGAGVFFALRDARRARRLLEDPPAKHVDPNKQELSKELSEKYDPGGPDYPHPVIIDHRCIGCEACVKACPHDVFTMVNNIAKPVRRDQCMQDMSCQAVCPVTPDSACIVVHAIAPKPRPFPICTDQLMSEQVPGCYIIGDVSGRRQIKNAANEGAKVIEHINAELDPQIRARHNADEYDVAIIGIGPAGLSAAIRAERLKLKYVAIEQDQVLSTLEAYPKDKEILFRPDDVPACSDIPIACSSDKCGNILEEWREAMRKSGVKINQEESCQAVTKTKDDGYFKIETEKKKNHEASIYRARRVVLAIGLRGTPMMLGGPGKSLPGENKDRVKYTLSNPDEFRDKRVLIVGGGNSAVEAALTLAQRSNGAKWKPANDNRNRDLPLLALAVRNGFTNDLAFASKRKLYQYTDKGEITLYWDTAVTEIRDGAVVLTDQHTHEEKVIANDYILALIGGDFPTKFLKTIGITIPES